MEGSIGFWGWLVLFIIFLPIMFFWAFALIDLFRRDDLSGWAVALWIVAIVFLPILGTLCYFIFRPVTAQDIKAEEEYKQEYEFNKAAAAADKLHKLAELRDKGDITPEQFEKQKAKLLKE